MSKISPVLVMLLSLFGAAFAEARAPMIQVGSGVETSRGGGVNVLLRVDYRGLTTEEPDNSWVDGYVARIRGDIAGSVDGIDYMEIELIPLGGGMIGTNDTEILMGEQGIWGQLLPVHLSRNVRMGREFTATVNAVGIGGRASFGNGSGGSTSPFIKIAVEALGYKLAKFAAENAGTYHGLSLFQAGMELGLAAANRGRSFRVLAAIGAEGGVAIGNRGTLLDGRIYAEARAEIRHFVEIFARGQRTGSELGDATELPTDMQLIAGVGLIF